MVFCNVDASGVTISHAVCFREHGMERFLIVLVYSGYVNVLVPSYTGLSELVLTDA